MDTYTVPQTENAVPQTRPAPPPFNRNRPGRKKRIIRTVIYTFIGLAIAAAMVFITYIVFFKPAPEYYLTGEIEIWDGTVEGQPSFIRRTINGHGTLIPEKQETVAVMSEEPVAVIMSNVWYGAQVSEGDTLVVLDSSAIERAIDRLRDDISKAEAKIAEYAAVIAEEYNEHLEERRNSRVTAPFSGRVLSPPELTVGARITPDTELGRLVDDSQMVLTLYFSYGYEDDIYIGQTCEVSIPSAMATIEGKVTRIEKIRYIGEDGSISFEVEITLPNPGALMSDTAATASMTTVSGESILPSAPGVLKPVRDITLRAGTRGTLKAYNLRNSHSYRAGDLLLEVNFDDNFENPYMDMIRSLETEIELAYENIDRQHSRMDDLVYTAPISGTIMSEVNLWPGSLVSHTVEITVAQTETLTLRGEIFQSDIQRVEVGMEAEVETYVWGEYTTIPGRLSSIDRTASQTGSGAFFPVVISVDNSQGQMMEGFHASFVLTLERSENPIVVPFRSVNYYGRDNFVWLKPKDGKKPENVMDLPAGLTPPGFYPIKVTIGISSARYVEITEGIDPEWRGWEVFTQKTDVMPSPRPEYEGDIEWEGESKEAFQDGYAKGWEARDKQPPEEPENPFEPDGGWDDSWDDGWDGDWDDGWDVGDWDEGDMLWPEDGWGDEVWEDSGWDDSWDGGGEVWDDGGGGRDVIVVDPAPVRPMPRTRG
jgi:multidrug efflux pump subunit AcrA (membrane-fusion protein)